MEEEAAGAAGAQRPHTAPAGVSTAPTVLQLEPLLQSIAAQGSLNRPSTAPARLSDSGTGQGTPSPLSTLYPISGTAHKSLIHAAGVIQVCATPGATQEQGRGQLTAALRELLSSYAQQWQGTLVQATFTITPELSSAHEAAGSHSKGPVSGPSAGTMTLVFDAMMLICSQESSPLALPAVPHTAQPAPAPAPAAAAAAAAAGAAGPSRHTPQSSRSPTRVGSLPGIPAHQPTRRLLPGSFDAPPSTVTLLSSFTPYAQGQEAPLSSDPAVVLRVMPAPQQDSSNLRTAVGEVHQQHTAAAPFPLDAPALTRQDTTDCPGPQPAPPSTTAEHLLASIQQAPEVPHITAAASLRSHLVSGVTSLVTDARPLVCSVQLRGAQVARSLLPQVGVQAPDMVPGPAGKRKPADLAAEEPPSSTHATAPARATPQPPTTPPRPPPPPAQPQSSMAAREPAGVLTAPQRPPSPPGAPDPPDAAPPPPPPTSPASLGDEGWELGSSFRDDAHEWAADAWQNSAPGMGQAGGAAADEAQGPAWVPPASLEAPWIPLLGPEGHIDAAQQPAQQLPSSFQAFYMHPPAVVLPPCTVKAAEPSASTSAAATAALPVGEEGGAVEAQEVTLYADCQAVKHELQDVLLAAGLPASLQEQVELLQVVVTEGETGRLVGCQQVAFSSVVSGGARLPAPVRFTPGLLTYLILAVVPAVQIPAMPLGAQPAAGRHDQGQPGPQVEGAADRPDVLMLASLPLLVLPDAAAEEVVWLFRAMVKEQAEQFGIPVPAEPVEKSPNLGKPSVSTTSAGVHVPQVPAQQPGCISALAPPGPSQAPLAISGQEGRPSQQHKWPSEPHTAPITDCATQLASFWMQRQSNPLHRVGGMGASLLVGGAPAAGGLTEREPLRHRQVWGIGCPAPSLQRVQEEGEGEQQQQLELAGSSPTQTGGAHIWASVRDQLIFVSRASADSSHTSGGSRTSSREFQQPRLSAEGSSPPGGPSWLTLLEGSPSQLQPVPPLHVGDPVASAVVAADQNPTELQRHWAQGGTASGSTLRVGVSPAPSSGLQAKVVPAPAPLAGNPAAAAALNHCLPAYPGPLLASAFNYHMAPFARDMALALNPPAGVPFHAASASQQAEAGGRVGAEGHSGRGAAGAMSGGLAGISGSATVEGQEVPEEVHAAVITAAKELLHFLAVHRMLGCFREVAHALTSLTTGPLLHLRLGHRSLSAEEAAELLAAAHQDPSVAELQLLPGPQEVLALMHAPGPSSMTLQWQQRELHSAAGLPAQQELCQPVQRLAGAHHNHL